MVSIPEEHPETTHLDPFHISDPLSRRYNSTSNSPVQLSTPCTLPQSVWTFNDTSPAAGTSKNLGPDLVKSDEVGNQKKRLSLGDRLRKLGRFGRDKDHVASTAGSNVASGSRQVVAAPSGNTSDLNPWLSGCETSRSSSSTSPSPAPNGRQIDSLSTLQKTRTDVTDNTTHLTQEPEPEAAILAKNIQHLVDSLPLPTFTPSPIIPPNPTLQSSPFSTPTLSQPNFLPSPYSPEYPLPTVTLPTDNSQPQPQLKDTRLIALLSNASFMNGSSLKGNPSIWSILESFHRTSSPNANQENSHLEPTIASTQHDDAQVQPLNEDEPPPPPASNMYQNQISNESSPSMAFSDTSSIMVYSPLFPTQSDFVELAELVPFDAESDEREPQAEERVGSEFGSEVVSGEGNVSSGVSQKGQGGTSWTLVWPFSIWYGPDQSRRSVSQTTSLNGNSSVTAEPRSAEFIMSNNFDTGSPITPNQRIRSIKSQKSIRAWVPSSSKISVQAFWWGYRLYLPPPILEILSDRTLEAAKRSAVITTALTWFFNNLPVEVFPPPMRPALILLQRLVPLLGYIGTFISWSWGTIRSYDVGCGVTLTATWILPVALIPGTWYERDFPKSPNLNSPIPLPRPLSMQSFVPPTPTTDNDIPTSAYATPMSSVVFGSPALPPTIDGEKWGFDPSLVSSSSSWSSSSPPQPLPISSPIYYPTMIPPNSLYFTPNSSTTHPLPTSTPTLPVPLTLNNPSSIPSSPPQSRTPDLNTQVRSSSPLINSNVFPSPHTSYNLVPPPPSPPTPTPIPTPIPIPIPIAPKPTELPPIPPELPLSPKLVNRLLRGPVLQTVPLPEVDDGVGVSVGVGVGVGGNVGVVDRTRSSSLKKKHAKIEIENGTRRMNTSGSSRRKV